MVSSRPLTVKNFVHRHFVEAFKPLAEKPENFFIKLSKKILMLRGDDNVVLEAANLAITLFIRENAFPNVSDAWQQLTFAKFNVFFTQLCGSNSGTASGGGIHVTRQMQLCKSLLEDPGNVTLVVELMSLDSI